MDMGEESGVSRRFRLSQPRSKIGSHCHKVVWSSTVAKWRGSEGFSTISKQVE